MARPGFRAMGEIRFPRNPESEKPGEASIGRHRRLNLLVIVAVTVSTVAAAVAFLAGQWLYGLAYGLLAVLYAGLWQE